MTAAKEAQMEEDRLQPRPASTPRTREAVTDYETRSVGEVAEKHQCLLRGQAAFAELSSTELRNMGTAVKEANSRLREHMAQASKVVSSRASLKRQKAVSPRNSTPARGITPLGSRGAGATGSSSPRQGSSPRPRVMERSGTVPRVVERSSTAPRALTRQVTQATSVEVRVEVAVATVTARSSSSESLPRFGQFR